MGFITRGSEHVVEVLLPFLYPRFNYNGNTFNLLKEPDYVVDLPTDATVVVLHSEPWFEWDDKLKPPGLTHVTSPYTSTQPHFPMNCTGSTADIGPVISSCSCLESEETCWQIKSQAGDLVNQDLR